jgi:ribosomal protein S18 acetylase RimI-like enzyme
MDGELHPQKALLPRVVYVVPKGDSPVGLIAGHLTRRLDCDGELEWIDVDPERRGSGIASELLRLLAEWFAKQKALRVCVDVDPGNAPAQKFYRRHGAEDLCPHWLVWPDIRVVLRKP